MKSTLLRFFSALTLGLGLITTANATLIDNGNGTITDTTNNLMWLQDANYAKSSGYDTDGLMNWNEANAWAANLVYGDYDDWRLPTVIDSGNNGCIWGDVECGINVDTSTSELAHMWYDILGNIAFPSLLNASANGVDVLNLQASWYWTGTECASNLTRDAWTFSAGVGIQACWNKEDWDNDGFLQSADSYAWAVRSIDAAASSQNQANGTVPEPGVLALMGLGLVGLRLTKRKSIK